MADLGFIPLIFWHPNTALIVLYRYGPVLCTQGGDLCPLLCSWHNWHKINCCVIDWQVVFIYSRCL